MQLLFMYIFVMYKSNANDEKKHFFFLHMNS